MTIDRVIEYCICLFVGIFIGTIIGAFYINKPKEQINTRTEVIDSLTKVNDSIKIKVEQLDSIKNAKVIEVSTLDNDSTLKLFYKLVSE